MRGTSSGQTVNTRSATRAANAQAIAQQYQNGSIYVMLSSRGALPGYHWGIFIPIQSPHGQVWHATNIQGGWRLEVKQSRSIPFSMSLVLAYKVGSIDISNLQHCVDILNSIPAEGQPSRYTNETFSCRVWVKDALIVLHQNQIIKVGAETVQEAEDAIVRFANEHKDIVESGEASARILNDTNYS